MAKPTNRKASAKGAVTRRSRNAGKLAHLKDMPLDIFFEIVSHLTPLDLLHISWVSKQFRGILTNKALRYLWVTARKNIPHIPDPPAGLSEPRYASLVFTFTCFNCGAKRAQKYHYALAVRYCAYCWKASIRKGSSLAKQHKAAKENQIIYTMLPTNAYWKYPPGQLPSAASNVPEDSYLVSEFETVVAKYVSLAHDTKAREAYVSERQEYTNERYDFSQAMLQWEKNRVSDQRKIELKREDSIKAKLVELGYAASSFPVFDHMHPGIWEKWLALARQPRELTPKIWKRIQLPLENLLTDWKECQAMTAREDRINLRNSELRNALKQLLPTAPVDDGPLPTYSDAKHIAEVHALLEDSDYTVPMTANRLSAALPALQAYARRNKTVLAKAVWSRLVEGSQPSSEWPRDWGYYGDLGLERPRRPAKTTPVDVKTLKGAPAGMEFGSEDILELTTSLFYCGHCYSWDHTDKETWNYKELAKHVHREHADSIISGDKPSIVDSSMARRILKALSLPEDTRYEDVSGRIVCTCADFKATSTFAELVSHVMWSTAFYKSLADNKYASTCDATDIIIPDYHDFDKSATPFVQLLADGDSFEQPPLTTAEQHLVQTLTEKLGIMKVRCKVCHSCTQIHRMKTYDFDRSAMFRVPLLNLKQLITHVKGMHCREPTIDDAIRWG